MQELKPVYDSTLLRCNATYQIDGCLYRFLGKDPYCSINAPKYIFSPAPGQRRKSNLVINHRQLLLKVYEVPNLLTSSNTTVTKTSVQMSLF